jgi:hypothetical protein
MSAAHELAGNAVWLDRAVLRDGRGHVAAANVKLCIIKNAEGFDSVMHELSHKRAPRTAARRCTRAAAPPGGGPAGGAPAPSGTSTAWSLRPRRPTAAIFCSTRPHARRWCVTATLSSRPAAA